MLTAGGLGAASAAGAAPGTYTGPEPASPRPVVAEPPELVVGDDVVVASFGPHPDVPGRERTCSYRPNELLVGSSSSADVVSATVEMTGLLADLGVDEVEVEVPDPAADVALLRLSGTAIDPYAVAAVARARGLAVAPNHVLALGRGDGAGPAEPLGPIGAGLRPAEPGGGGTSVAIVDTGWDPDAWTLPTIVRGATSDVMVGADAGHGTFVAGAVAQRAPDARIIAIVPDDLDADHVGPDGGPPHAVTDEVAVLEALADLPEQTVVQLDFGAYPCFDARVGGPQDPLTSVSPRLLGIEAAIEREIDRGGLVVVPAGDDATEVERLPAALASELAHVVAVGSIDASGTASPFSNGFFTTQAVGEYVISTYPPGLAASGIARWSGTTVAAACVSAELARVMSTGLEPIEAIAALQPLLDCGLSLPPADDAATGG